MYYFGVVFVVGVVVRKSSSNVRSASERILYGFFVFVSLKCKVYYSLNELKIVVIVGATLPHHYSSVLNCNLTKVILGTLNLFRELLYPKSFRETFSKT